MNTATMTKRKARTIGVVYFLFFPASIVSDRLLSGLIVQNDAAATANHILAHESLFRAGVAMALVNTALYLALTALFYELFKPVNRWVSFVAAFFGLVGCTIQAGGSVFELFSLVVLQSPPGTSVLNAEQLPGLALLFLKLNDQAVLVALVFFAVYCLLIGYLILRSTFLPRFLGALMVLAGFGWLTFLYEPLANHFSPYIQVLGVAAEGLLMLWLLVMGVNAERWQEQAHTMDRYPENGHNRVVTVDKSRLNSSPGQ